MIKKYLLALSFLCILKVSSQDNNAFVTSYLDKLVERNTLSKKDVQSYKITDSHTSRKSEVKHFYFRQSYNGVEIVGTESGLHILPDGLVVSSSNNFITNIEDKILANSRGSISNRDAILRVAQQMNYPITGSLRQNAYGYGTKLDPNKAIFTDGGISKVPIPVKKIYYSREFEKPVLAWQLSIYEISGENWFNFYVNAETGEILAKNNWKTSCGLSNHECSDHSHKSEMSSLEVSVPTTDDSKPFGGSVYNVFALPLENPFFGPRTLEVDPHNLIASPFGWHDTNGSAGAEFTVTRGNNVNAYEDGDNPGYQPDGGTSLTFDYPFNPVFSAGDQSEDAAITNLFYWSNIIHDIIYLYGFDEESGNFQVNNYNGLGVGNDPVNAEAQDGSGSCNANFFTPPDGSSGVMQMYTCDFRDGDFDNHVIIHEYGHGISIRLTGGGSNSDCLFNDEQMGEGWSDWYGSIFTMTASDLPTDLKTVGNWLFGQDQDGPGIRDYPYTTDLSQDPRTYDYIKTTFGPHPLGSTWAAMLWELTWGLIEEHGFDPDVYNGTGGNNIAIALVTEGLKLQPCSPGFVDGRDAILAADIALYGGANQCIIWDAFAKRGLGFSAVQGSSGSRIDGVEAFDTPTTNLDIEENSFCFFESSVVLGGGIPIGGVYSGPGVTDNGDGITFTFDPTTAGQGTHTITYTATSICSTSGTATDTIEVTNGEPEIICQDITLTLDSSDTLTIVPEDIVTNFLPSEGYTLDQSGTFSPEDISAGSSTVTLFDDQVSSALPIGFDFNFYQNTYSNFYISSNGFITFDSGGESGCCAGQNLPSGSLPNNLIAFAWDDLYPPGSGTIRYATIGSAPNRILVVDVVDIPFCCDSTPEVTTQVKLFEGSNVIEIHSTDVSGSPMTQGIENIDGTLALTVPNRNSETISFANDFVAFIPNTGSFPDNCGLETTVIIDIDTFDCSNIGDNLVTATVTDTNGNTASCTATVTVLPNSGAELDLATTLFCEDEGLMSGLSGGSPIGGVYGGTGVTDDGNGTTFSFDPAVAGAGMHTITYSSMNSCGTVTSSSQDVEVQPAIPDIVCQDITLALELNGTATIEPSNILLGGDISGSLYALNPFSANSNISRYDYNAIDDTISVDTGYNGSTQIERNFAMDSDPSSGTVYIMSATSNSAARELFSFDIETGNGGAQLIGTIVSVTGNTNPQAMAFGPDGTLYFAFNNGEINAYNVSTQTMNAFSNVSGSGAVGLTYDYDNNRLIRSSGTGTVSLSAIDLATGTASSLFSVTPGCGAQAIEYVGNKLIASSTGGCNKVYIIDLNTQSATDLLNPSQTFTSIKDFMYLGGLPVDNCNGQALTFTLDQDSFTCADIGDNMVTVTATDGQGNQTSCTAVVTVTLPEPSELIFDLATTLFCEDEGLVSGLSGGSPVGGVYSG
ncbi:M36 family metallopeptidase, partial [Winogradskyella sp.]|uniref:M36 family metallopeptidase n=1 Tax=Winogradskyella sp. TaxID=1883156 RepID=UPI002611E337